MSHADSFDGVNITYEAILNGTVAFDMAAGNASGSWEMQGFGGLDFSGELAGFIHHEYDVVGSVTGNRSVLSLTGTQTVGGFAFFDIPGVGYVGDGDIEPVVSDIGPLDVAVVETHCDLIVGDWESPLRLEAADAGMINPSLDGTFVVAWQGETAQSDLWERFLELWEDGAAWEEHYLETGEIDMARGNEIANRMVELELDRLDGIDECIFDDEADRDTFVRAMTRAAIGIGRLAMTELSLAGSSLEDMADFLLFFGAVGAGAADPVAAAELETLFKLSAERILNDRVSTTDLEDRSCSVAAPCLGIDASARGAIRVADRLGLELDVAGGPIPGANSWRQCRGVTHDAASSTACWTGPDRWSVAASGRRLQ